MYRGWTYLKKKQEVLDKFSDELFPLPSGEKTVLTYTGFYGQKVTRTKTNHFQVGGKYESYKTGGVWQNRAVFEYFQKEEMPQIVTDDKTSHEQNALTAAVTLKNCDDPLGTIKNGHYCLEADAWKGYVKMNSAKTC